MTQQRSLNGYRGICQQGGIEILARFGFAGAGARVADEALELLAAPNCPSGRMDVLLAPDQMVLQIHESIGHPLELDRILGDERNFAGTSFVTPDMFGTLPLRLRACSNITFDPTRPEELASYAFDDDGTPAEKTWLIRDGILERPLGGAISQARAGLPGVANARADELEPAADRPHGQPEPRAGRRRRSTSSSRASSTACCMETNSSWSIDDSRNKFQFGCERGRMIENGNARRRRQEPELSRHQRRVLAQPRARRQRGYAYACSARRSAARASRRRRSASAMRRPHACSRASTCSAGKH